MIPQDAYLNELVKSKAIVTVILTNGFQFTEATIVGFDTHVIYLQETRGSQNMIYKHALSTVKPKKALNLKEIRDAAREKSGK